ncbi:ATP-binding cassette sub-family b member 1 [Plakobranchus ocellatus]|uniref:ATP-binding cassette sub-family b member 1 n=1 Tax=Plakobranchus ocellatus TaxID=259542 RepID=A0AAV4DRA5_9GAST|nr:ATP-binding cassette sub-family b member 1 [Plakobranchus ocellatus]
MAFPSDETNGNVTNSNNVNKLTDKRQLVDNQELPPKYSATNGPGWSTAEDGDGEDEKGKTKAPKVGLLELFRFADRTDIVLVCLAALCSIIHGVSYPVMVMLFAKAVQMFVNQGRFDRLLGHSLAFLHANNMTWSETRKHLDDFEPYCAPLIDFYNGTEHHSCEILNGHFDNVFDKMDTISLEYISISIIRIMDVQS